MNAIGRSFFLLGLSFTIAMSADTATSSSRTGRGLYSYFDIPDRYGTYSGSYGSAVRYPYYRSGDRYGSRYPSSYDSRYGYNNYDDYNYDGYGGYNRYDYNPSSRRYYDDRYGYNTFRRNIDSYYRAGYEYDVGYAPNGSGRFRKDHRGLDLRYENVEDEYGFTRPTSLNVEYDRNGRYLTSYYRSHDRTASG